MSDPLTLLKKELSRSGSTQLITEANAPTEDITNATTLKLVKLNKTFPLTGETIYSVDGAAVTLKVIIFTWINRDLPRSEYLEACYANKVDSLGVLHKTDVVQWLDGTKGEFEFSSSGTDQAGDDDVEMGDADVKVVDPFLESVLSQERNIVDHNTSLRGSKGVDFSTAAELCKILYLQVPKKGSKRSSNDTDSPAPSGKKSKKPSTPIILISPAASALLTMANVKVFLQEGRYIDPNTTDPAERDLLNSSDLANVTHVFPRLGKITFMVVDKTDKFSKQEHWDRTVAVFTTGQTWQFKSYKWSTPSELFQKVKGYYFHYDKDPTPPSVKDWNVERIGLDKHKRFKDAVVLNSFWDSLEKAMISKGYETI